LIVDLILVREVPDGTLAGLTVKIREYLCPQIGGVRLRLSTRKAKAWFMALKGVRLRKGA